MVDIALDEAARRFDEFAVVVKQGGGVAEEDFGLSGQRHIEVGQGKAQVFLRTVTAHFADGMADDACGRVFPCDVGVGFGADVYRVFQAGGDSAVVFGGNEQYAGGGFDGFAEGSVAFGRGEVGFGGVVVVEIVERQAADFDDLGFVAFGEHGDDVLRHFAGERSFTQAAY